MGTTESKFTKSPFHAAFTTMFESIRLAEHDSVTSALEMHLDKSIIAVSNPDGKLRDWLLARGDLTGLSHLLSVFNGWRWFRIVKVEEIRSTTDEETFVCLVGLTNIQTEPKADQTPSPVSIAPATPSIDGKKFSEYPICLRWTQTYSHNLNKATSIIVNQAFDVSEATIAKALVKSCQPVREEFNKLMCSRMMDHARNLLEHYSKAFGHIMKIETAVLEKHILKTFSQRYQGTIKTVSEDETRDFAGLLKFHTFHSRLSEFRPQQYCCRIEVCDVQLNHFRENPGYRCLVRREIFQRKSGHSSQPDASSSSKPPSTGTSPKDQINLEEWDLDNTEDIMFMIEPVNLNTGGPVHAMVNRLEAHRITKELAWPGPLKLLNRTTILPSWNWALYRLQLLITTYGQSASIERFFSPVYTGEVIHPLFNKTTDITVKGLTPIWKKAPKEKWRYRLESIKPYSLSKKSPDPLNSAFFVDRMDARIYKLDKNNKVMHSFTAHLIFSSEESDGWRCIAGVWDDDHEREARLNEQKIRERQRRREIDIENSRRRREEEEERRMLREEQGGSFFDVLDFAFSSTSTSMSDRDLNAEATSRLRARTRAEEQAYYR